MKKINSKGFTLIELLAVITIMGILMMVAIPSVSRTIENSRRDTFATVAKEYVNSIRNRAMADNIDCEVNSNWVVASATPNGTYYFPIDTSSQGTKDLMESGGKSPFGNAEMKGYVKWVKTTEKNSSGDLKMRTTYTILMVDSGLHGFDEEVGENDIKRSQVETATDKVTAFDSTPTSVSGAYKCRLS